MRCRHTKPDQFELFAPPEGTCLLQTPRWQNLPYQTRNEVTSLVARLLMEHGHRERNEPGGAVADPLQSRENGDV